VLPLTGVRAAVPARPAVTVAVSPSAPVAPVGLESADIVVLEAGNAAARRLLALFHSTDAPEVGPVGPTGPVDGRLLRLYGGVFAYSGGPSRFVRQIDALDLPTVNALATPSAFTVRSAVPFTSTAALRTAAKATGAPPPSVLSYREAGAAVSAEGATVASSVRVSAPGLPTATWTWDAAKRVWRGVGIVAGTVTAANVVIQQVAFEAAPLDNSGTRTAPTAQVVGSGRAYVLTDGQLVSATWSKEGPQKVTNYVDRSGSAVRMAPGRTWIALLPANSTVGPA